MSARKAGWTDGEIVAMYAVASEWRNCILGISDNIPKVDGMRKRNQALQAIQTAVNSVGGKNREKKDCFHKIIDYKSLLRCKVKNLETLQKQSGDRDIKDTEKLSKLDVMCLAFYDSEYCEVVPRAWQRVAECDPTSHSVDSVTDLFGKTKIAEL